MRSLTLEVNYNGRGMSDRLKNLEHEVTKLSPDELREFASWFLEYDQSVWEKQIEADAKAGRLNFLVEEAKAEYKANKLKDL